MCLHNRMLKVLGDYSSAILEFGRAFDKLYLRHGVNMTLKVHVIVDYYKQYFDQTGKTLRDTNGEFVEAAHSSLRISEENHGMKVVRKLWTPVHQMRSLQSITFYNSKRAGNVTPLRLRKLSSPSLTPSPLSSPSI